MKTGSIIIVTAIILLVGCVDTNDHKVASSEPSVSSENAYRVSRYGVVEGIESVSGSNGGIADSGIGAGTIIGGVVGGVLGNQVGGGSGKKIATAVGVVGGAVIGNQLDKRNQQSDSYIVHVRLDNGSRQTIPVDGVNDLRVGDHVRIDNGQVSRY